MRCRLEDLLTFMFSVDAVEDEIDDEMHEVKESKEDKFLMKDFDPFFPLKGLLISYFLTSSWDLWVSPI